MSLTLYGRNLHANVLSGRVTMPSSFWLMLLLSLPDPAEPMATTAAREPSGASYDRVEVLLGSSHWSAASGGVSALTDPITYLPEENWGLIVGWGLATDNPDGDLYRFGALAGPISAKMGVELTINGYPRIEVAA